ncbi:hypothetical protein HID58_061275 [Brassica napus]|uniref:ATPase AAA-type core domain-containing protein n=1 Tax=Brassica napus TaxID=3708 RepID=A0ABQ7ZY41_BRANA|nr:hypothetical protein HID58_061275 [Brassica napus]
MTNVRVMVLAATNRPSELDEAIMRRLPQAFEIGIPERKERAEILKVTLKGERVEPDIDYDHLALSYENVQCCCIHQICKSVDVVPRPMSQLDLEKVLATSKKTQVAASEYCGLRWSREPNEMEAAISGISKLLDGDIRSIKPFEILKLLNLSSDSSEVVHVHSKP